MKICGIYSIRCTVSGKVYYGQSQDIRKRLTGHRRKLYLRKHSNRHLQSAWNKYGESAFVFAIEIECDVTDLDIVEQCYLDANHGGYNIAVYAEAATRGLKYSAESRAKMSAAHVGRKHSRETIEKIVAANTGKKMSPDCIRKSAEKRKLLGSNLGSKRSPETRAKMSAASLGRKKSPEHCANISMALRGRKLISRRVPIGYSQKMLF